MQPDQTAQTNTTPYFLIIDLKSFYASVECAERGMDPMTTNLVVADPTRSKNTICLAVSPSMKALGVKNRCRIGDIPPALTYIIAKPRMQKYLDYSARIVGIYRTYFAKEDIHQYSVDEAFMDATHYLGLYRCTPKQLGLHIMGDIWDRLHIRATCGVGTNLYLAKIALDIMAKHAPDYVGELTEQTFCEKLWHHRPLTDFWRIGPGTQARLMKYGIMDMADIARADPELLYREFGVDAELMIDHAWGRETTTMADIHGYESKSKSVSNGQVVMRDYTFEEARTVVCEQSDLLSLELVRRRQVTKSVSLYIGYSQDHLIPGTGGTASLPELTSADRIILPAVEKLYLRTTFRNVPIRRIMLCANDVKPDEFHQFSLFEDYDLLERNKRIQRAALEIKVRYGKNALLKGMNLLEESTTKIRNKQIGGHGSGEDQT